MIISYAQNFEDVLLNRVFADVVDGFYVDVGANHPINDSVTKHFYDVGWHGINVEPGLGFALLKQARPRDINLHLAASDHAGRAEFYEHPSAAGTSTLAADLPDTVQELSEDRLTYEVELKPLRTILAEHAPEQIDFMSVDVEGHEQQVLKGNDWSRFRPRVLVVEATIPNTNALCHHEWEGILRKANYKFVYFDGINRFYVRREDLHLERHFSRPVNVLDRFVRADAMHLRRLCERYQQGLAATVQELESLRETEEHDPDSTAPLKKDLAAVTKQNAVQARQIACLEQELAASQRDVDSLEQALRSRTDELKAARHEAVTCSQDAKLLRQELDLRSAESNSQRGAEAAINGELESLRQELASRNRELRALEHRMESRDEHISWLTRRTGGRSLALGLKTARSLHRLTKL